MMEVKGSLAFVITAQQAPSASFLDEQLFDPAAPVCDGFRSAALASISAMLLEDELRFAMACACACGLRQLSPLDVRPPPHPVLRANVCSP
jgi:hypothetical protein